MASKIDGVEEKSTIERAEVVQRYQRQMEELAAQQAAKPSDPTPAQDAARQADQQIATDSVAKTEDAARQASQQQDRGQDWTRYADKAQAEVPQSVEDAARQARELEQENDARQEEHRRVTAAELQNQFTLQSGRIRG